MDQVKDFFSFVIVALVWTGILGIIFLIIGFITGGNKTEPLPSYLQESEFVGEYCAEYLEELRPGAWSTAELRICIDRKNGYTDADGKTVHPFS